MNNFKTFFNKFKYGIIMILIGIIVAVFDMVTKVVTEGKSLPFIEGFFRIQSSHNTGAAWSILNKHTWILIIISVIFIVVILIFNVKYRNKNMLYAISLGLILGGAICNLFDRIVLGYVRDFICLEFISFPIFNIADSAICVGVVLLAIFFIFCSGKKEKN